MVGKTWADFYRATCGSKRLLEGNILEHAPFITEIAKYVKVGDKVLDIGSGTGVIGAPLVGAGIKVVSVDNDPEILKMAHFNSLVLEVDIEFLEADVLEQIRFSSSLQISSEPWLSRFLPVRGRTFLDVGAHIGEWSKPLSTCFERIIAFEPSSEARVEFGVPGKNIELREEAVWSSEGILSFGLFKSSAHGKISSVGRIDEAGPKLGDAQVKAVTLDSVSSSFGRIDFIKIDTEGAEVEVVKGAVETIKKHMPFMIIENHSAESRAWLEANLPGMGYEVEIVYHPHRVLSDPYYEIHVWLICKRKYSLPFADREFRVAFSQGLLEHYSDADIGRIIAEHQRVSDVVVVSVPVSGNKGCEFGDERHLTMAEWEALLQPMGACLGFVYGHEVCACFSFIRVR